MLGKQAQAATEFLMAYGWAIIIGILAIAALAYLGILNPEGFLPNKCILPAGITCADYRVESYRIVLVLQNDQEPITIDKVIASANEQECVNNKSTTLSANQKAIFILTDCNNGVQGNKFDGIINITYTPANKLSHNIEGILKSKVEEGFLISTSSICQNAQDNSLCEGLDLVYGTGYGASCCGEYSLCC